MKNKIGNALKNTLFSIEPIFTKFLKNQVEDLGLALIGATYLPLLFALEIYLSIDIYISFSRGEDLVRPVLMLLLTASLIILYLYRISKIKRKKKNLKVDSLEELTTSAPGVFLNSFLRELQAEREQFFKKLP